jgi:nitroreductase
MKVKKAIEIRRSIRSFTDEDVSISEIKKILHVATFAPSINNSQPWEFLLIKNKDLLSKMAVEVKNSLKKIEKFDNPDTEQIMKKVEWYSTFFKDSPAVIAIIQSNYTTILEEAVKLSQKEINELRNYPDIQSIGALIQNILLYALEFGYGTCWLSAPSIAGTSLQTLLGIEQDKRILAYVAIGKPKVIPHVPERRNIDEIFKVVE